MPVMCGTCPFRPDSPYRDLYPMLAGKAMTESSRICHSTGNSTIFHKTGKPDKLCRGARDFQLSALFAMGFLESPTDAAWIKKCAEMGIAPDTCIIK